jgi:hypothetical protein
VVNPNNHQEKTAAENVLNRLQVFLSSLKSKLEDTTKELTDIPPEVKEYQDAVKARIEMIEKVAREHDFKTGNVAKLNPLDTASFIKGILQNKGPLTLLSLKNEISKLGISSNLNAAIENLVMDKALHKKYSDLYDGYVYYLDGQKIPSVEDYEPDILNVLKDTHKTTTAIEEALDGKIGMETLKQVLKQLSYNGKIMKTRDVEGDYVWHLPDYDLHEKSVDKYKDQIIDWVKEYEAKKAEAEFATVTGAEIIDHFSYEKGWNITSILDKMVKNGLLHVEEGTYGQDDIRSLRLTTTPVANPKPANYTDTKTFLDKLFKGA